MAELKAILEAGGVRFMTPILRYEDANGAGLRQLFTATERHFFVEFAQRIPGADGEPFGGFNTTIIDDLYAALDASESYWSALTPVERVRHRSWIPRQVRFRPPVHP